MIIWGSTGKEKEIAAGRFFCPRCMAQCGYRHIRVSNYFTLYFIPLFPTETLGDYVQCRQCLGQFKPEVLRIPPAELKAMISPWKCLSCGNLNAPGVEQCLNCGGTVRAAEGVPMAVPVGAQQGDRAGASTSPEQAESVPVLPASPPTQGSHECPACTARFDPDGWDGDSLVACPHCRVTIRPVARR
jgi:hypothetical protein